jgi:hypothetical protein
LAVAQAGGQESNQLPARLLATLREAKRFELISLDPDGFRKDVKADDRAFYGTRVLGVAQIKDPAVRKRIVEALVKGLEGKIEPAPGFKALHGLSAGTGKEAVDLLISFERGKMHVLPATGKPLRLLIGKPPARVFDEVLRAAKIPQAK